MKEAKGLRKITGLMFRSEDTEPLIFNFNEDILKPIHSLFVFFSFLAIWFDKDGKIISWYVVEPFCYSIRPIVPYRTLIEIPFNDRNKGLIKDIMERF